MAAVLSSDIIVLNGVYLRSKKNISQYWDAPGAVNAEISGIASVHVPNDWNPKVCLVGEPFMLSHTRAISPHRLKLMTRRDDEFLGEIWL